MKLLLSTIGPAALLTMAVGVSSAQAQMRFQGLDRDHNGKITRDEWRGSDQSFRNQDWNNDGELSGDEVRPGARRPTAMNQNRDWNGDGVIDQQDALIAQRFRGYDRNGDGRITMDEWNATHADSWLFTRLDNNRDRSLSLDEYAFGGGVRMESQGDWRTGSQGGPSNGFVDLDRNRDGWISRNEWSYGNTEFNRIDMNRDNRISRQEFNAAARYSNSSTYQDNTNYDNNGRSSTYRTAWDRGLAEGRQAGREDYVNGHGWDLEGQTELERADSGYYSQLGPLTEYQAGYRDAFRVGYRAGFNEH